jgi:hypothetical protein
MAEILLGVLAEQLAFMATDGALNNNLGSGGGYRIYIRWSHALTLLANCVRRNMNRQDDDCFYNLCQQFPGKARVDEDTPGTARG